MIIIIITTIITTIYALWLYISCPKAQYAVFFMWRCFLRPVTRCDLDGPGIESPWARYNPYSHPRGSSGLLYLVFRGFKAAGATCWPPTLFYCWGCECVGAIPLPPLRASMGMSWGWPLCFLGRESGQESTREGEGSILFLEIGYSEVFLCFFPVPLH